jgi:tetratricopeptide (TPR) repeat protein
MAFAVQLHFMSLLRCLAVLPLAAALLAGVVETYAQSRPGERSTDSARTAQGSIRGRVILPSGSFTDEAVKITLSTLRGALATIYTESQGQFEFQEVPPGTYYLEFEADRRRFHLVNETVQVYRGMPAVLTVTLKPITTGETPKPNTVSVAELTEKVPDKARKEFDKASVAGAQGKTDEAIAHLRKAIAIHPTFVRAHNDLGTYLLGQGKLEAAEEAFRQAITLDPDAFNPLLNLGIVLVHKNSFIEAADRLKQALSLEPNSPAAHLYAGLAFSGMNNLDPAETELKTAYSLGGQKYGVALYHLGQLYMTRGDRAAALKLFQEYLSVVPDARNAQQVRKLIAMLHP